MEVVIANATYREGLFADIGYKDIYWAMVSYDAASSTFIVEVFAPPGGEDKYVFPLEEVQEALERAKQKLMELGYGNTDGG
jgi:hypothetical protein